MKIQIPDKLQFLFRPKKVKVLFGGRVGAKTVNIVRALLAFGANKKTKILCLREYMNSIDDSVHSTFEEQIDILGLNSFYEVQRNKINGQNGTEIRYDNFARNINSVKGKDNFDYYWVEEAETAAQKSLDILEPTARKENSEIWVSFNPEDEFGPVYKTYVYPYLDQITSNGYYEDDGIFVCKTSIYDNPFASEKALQVCEELKKKDFKKWLWVYGGEPYGDYTDSIIQPEWFDSAIDAHIKLGFSAVGVRSQGFDLADTGDAKTTYFRHGSVVSSSDRWTDGELPEAIDRAFDHAERNRSEFLVYDADGMGASMKVYLANVTTNKRIQVEPYYGSGKVDNPDELYSTYEGQPEKDRKTNKDTFRNKRSQYYISLADRFESTYNAITKGIYTDPERMISLSSDLPHLDILKSELIKIKRIVGNNSFVQIQSKKDALKEGIKSPNDADALKMCFANPAPTAKIVRINAESEF
jgi:phage terminase large subunit